MACRARRRSARAEPSLALALAAAVLLLFSGAAVPARAHMGCTLDYTLSGSSKTFHFNFTSLIRDDGRSWVVSHSPFVYYINVCEPLQGDASTCLDKDPDASVCQDLSTPSPTSNFPYIAGSVADGAGSSFRLADPGIPENGVLLTYGMGPKNPAGSCKSAFARTTEILFKCDPDAGLGFPTFLNETDDCTYVFEWLTNVVCIGKGAANPYERDCLVEDPRNVGVTYDLSFLSRYYQNWHADAQGSNYTYFINVCRPLASDPLLADTTCAKEGTGACQYLRGSSAPKLAYNLGVGGDPKMDSSGTITIDYVGGDPCPGIGPRTATITFSCNHESIGEPKFIRETVTGCHYLFEWETSVICGPDAPSTGSDCKVQDPVTGFVYDLSAAGVPGVLDSEVQVTDDDGSVLPGHFYAGLCNPPTGGVCGSGVGACLKYGGKTDPKVIDMGKATSNLILQSPGELSLEYNNGAECKAGVRYTTLVDITCDPKQDISNPDIDVASRDDCTILLSYSTPLACPPVTVQCSVTAPDGSEFDLSDLIRSDGNYETTGDGFNYELNVCQPLNSPPAGCPPNSAGCQLSGPTSTIPNPYGIGQATGPSLRKTADGWAVSLHYYNGSADGCGGKQRATHIDFICDESGLGEPSFLREDSCDYYFTWQSSAACPAKGESSQTCAVKDPTSGYTFDLSKLVNPDKDYTMVSGDYTYTLQLCAAAKSCGTSDAAAAGCQKLTSGSAAATSIGAFPGELSVFEDTLTMVYSGGEPCGPGGKPRTTIIEFVCDTTAIGTQGPVFDNENDTCTYVFKWRTTYACPPVTEEVDCTVTDLNGHAYDLSRLIHNDGNYHAEGPDFAFEVNVCRVLVASDDHDCPPTAAACQIPKTGDRSDKSLGVPSRPQVDPVTGNVFLAYQHGRGGCNGEHERSTRIDFLCPPDRTSESDLVFVREDTDTCTYYFEWVTPDACMAMDEIVTGSGCAVEDPISKEMVDLSSLAKTYTLTGTDTSGNAHSYKVSVCQSTPQTCGSNDQGKPDTGAGACQDVDGGSGHSMGKLNTDLKLNQLSGFLFLEYPMGDLCHHVSAGTQTIQSHRMTRIEFVCDPDVTSPALEFVDEDECVYIFAMRTPLACLPDAHSQHCSVESDSGKLYDLALLANSKFNYKATDTVSGHSYVLNVCRPVVPEADLFCKRGSAACQHASNGKDFSLGMAAAPTLNSYGELILSYTGGTTCGSIERSTLIRFSCPIDPVTGKPESGIIGTPTFLGETSTCKYEFEWRSSVACSEDDADTVGASCRVTDPQLGQEYDLSPLQLAGSNYATQSKGASPSTFLGNVCGAITTNTTTSAACAGAGLCEVTSTGTVRSLGKTSSALHYHDGNLRLLYADGSACGAGGAAATYTSEIAFFCSPDFAFRLESISGCHYSFVVYTPRACVDGGDTGGPVECVASAADGTQYDLSPLSDVAYYRATVDRSVSNYSFVLSVCKPLPVGDAGLQAGCAGDGSAACQTLGSYSYKLGKVAAPSVADDGALVIQLDNGEVCGSGADAKPRKTLISFVCSHIPGDIGRPRFIGETKLCEYEFEWVSSAACRVPGTGPGATATTTLAPGATTLPAGTPPCSVMDPVTGHVYDLTPLQDHSKTLGTGVLADVPEGHGFQYNLAVCSSLSTGCAADPKAAGCQSDGGSSNYALGDFTEPPKFAEGVLSLHYTEQTGDTSCLGGGRQTLIEFECDPSTDFGTPRYEGEFKSCEYSFTWPTKYACGPRPETPCVVTHPTTGEEFDLSLLTREAGEKNWVALSEDGSDVVFELNVCAALQTPSASDGTDLGVCSGASACATDTTGKRTAIGEAQGAPAFSSDDAVTLTYSTAAPASDKSCDTYYTDISFYCRRGFLGTPEFVGKVGCMYFFQWETSVACSKDFETVGADCKVTDPVLGNTYDLSQLKGHPQTATDARGFTYTVGVCQALASGDAPCTGSTNGGCQSDGSTTTYATGEVNDKPIYEDGDLRLIYDNGPACHVGQKVEGPRQTMITFKCDASKGAADSGQLEFVAEGEQCVYHFIWHTKYACAGAREASCVLSHGGKAYDVSGLALGPGQGNYRLQDKAHGESYWFELNVCRGLNYDEQAAKCSLNSGACQLPYDSSGSHYNLGTPQDLRWDDTAGTLVINYVGGDADLCPDGKSRSAELELYCDASAGQGQPVFKGEPTPCHYVFSWTTAAACSADGPAAGAACQVEDKLQGVTFNLSPLKTSEATVAVPITGHKSISLKLCGPADSCADVKVGSTASSACFVNSEGTKVSLGASGQPTLSEGGQVAISYTGGSSCLGAIPYSARVAFECDSSASAASGGSHPLYSSLSRDGCHYEFVWYTDAVCVSSTPCTVLDFSKGRVFDLAPLRAHTRPVPTDMGTVHVGLCAAPPDQACASTSDAACLVKDSGAVISLGSFQGSGVDTNGHPFVKYGLGGSCGSGSYQTNLRFECQQGVGMEGSPAFESYSESTCTINLVWKTCVVCDIACDAPTAKPDTGSPTTPAPPSPPSPGDHSGSKGGSGGGGSKAGVVVAVVIIVVLVAVVVGYIMYSPERRIRFMAFFGRGASQPRYQYTPARTSDLDALMGGGSDEEDEDEDDEPEKDDQLLAI